MWLLSAILWASLWMARMASRSLSASGSVDLNWSWAEIRPWGKRRDKGQPRPAEVPRAGQAGADLDLLNGVDDEHVLEVLHGTLHPVVEGGCALGIFQVQLVNGLQLLLCFLAWVWGDRDSGGRSVSQQEGEGSGEVSEGPKGSEHLPEGRLQMTLPHLTSKASLRLWVREPRASHWSQIFWQRVLTLWES